MTTPLESKRIQRLSPTSLATLRICPLRYNHGQVRRPKHGAVRDPILELGTIAHTALEQYVRQRPGDLNSLPDIGKIWDSVVNTAERDPKLAATLVKHGPIRQWRRYETVRARCTTAVARLEALIREAGTPCTLDPEQALESPSGEVFGIADLVVNGPNGHWVVDYKTGTVVDPEGVTKSTYVGQLQIYAYLEHIRSGHWPDRAILFPFRGPLVDVGVDPEDCDATAEELHLLISEYNRRVPDEQPASPSPEACRYCYYAVACDAFWTACAPDWAEDIRAVEGVIDRVHFAALGNVAIELDAQAGTEQGAVELRGIDAVDWPTAVTAVPGSRIRVVGLWQRSGAIEGTVEMQKWGSLEVSTVE